MGGAEPEAERLLNVDRKIGVRTPESIAFTYELAGLGSRFLALAIDQALQVLAVVALVVGVVLAGAGRTSVVGPLRIPGGGEKTAEAIAIAIVVTVVFTIFFGYFIVFETLWNGQTPGKKALGIRVVRDGGYPIDFAAALVRNLLRVGELTLGYYALSVVSMLLSHENKRLGDFAAGTIVVRDSRLAYAPRPVSPRAHAALGFTLSMSGAERAMVKRFLDRRDALDPYKRRELAGKIAALVRERAPVELRSLDDESLLESI